MNKNDKTAVMSSIGLVALLVLANLWLMQDVPGMNPFVVLFVTTISAIICGAFTLLKSLFTKTYKLTFLNVTSTSLNLAGCFLTFFILRQTSWTSRSEVSGYDVFSLIIAVLAPVIFVLQLWQLTKHWRSQKMHQVHASQPSPH